MKINWDIVLKPNRVIMKGDMNYVIPSKMFPLNGSEYKVFHTDNTENFDLTNERDRKIAQIFDVYNVKVGRCYSNTQAISDALNEAEIKHSTMSGWLFLEPYTAPVHHAFILIDNNKIIDPAIAMKLEIYNKLKNSPENPEEALINLYTGKQLNHEKYGFGKVDPLYYYIASESSPEVARETFRELLKSFPDHISLSSMRLNKQSSTPIQDKIRDTEKRR